MKKGILILLMIVAWQLSGCDKDCNVEDPLLLTLDMDEYYENEIFNETFMEFYGNWKLYEISGGIHGQGEGLSFDFLIVQQYGIYAFVKDGQILEYGKIEIDEQTSETLNIIFVPDDDSDVFMFDTEKIVEFQDDNSLILRSPCCDRYNYHFIRINT